MKKRGLSPVIATTLLISLALVLAIIVFIWARSFVTEKAQKFGEPVESACDDVSFVIDAVKDGGSGINEPDRVDVSNTGNVPLYGIEIKRKGVAFVKSVDAGIFGEGLPSGSGESLDVNFGSEVNVGDEVNIIPIILGETESYKKAYTCPEEFGEVVQVI